MRAFLAILILTTAWIAAPAYSQDYYHNPERFLVPQQQFPRGQQYYPQQQRNHSQQRYHQEQRRYQEEQRYEEEQIERRYYREEGPRNRYRGEYLRERSRRDILRDSGREYDEDEIYEYESYQRFERRMNEYRGRDYRRPRVDPQFYALEGQPTNICCNASANLVWRSNRMEWTVGELCQVNAIRSIPIVNAWGWIVGYRPITISFTGYGERSCPITPLTWY